VTDAPARVPVAARVAFGLVLASLPVMVAVKHHASEPYPALYQPSFDYLSMRGDVLDYTRYVVTARDSDGAWHKVSPERIFDFPSVEDSHALSLSRGFFGQTSLATSPEAAPFLRDRLIELGVANPVQLRVRVFKVRMHGADASTAHRAGLRREYRIDLPA
jgi:hypothetical protein